MSRQRLVYVGAAMAAALLTGGLAACTKGQPDAQGSTTPPTSPMAAVSASPVASASPSRSVEAPPTLGPTGYGALRLGMTKAEAEATGLTTGITTSSGTGSCGGPGDGYLAGTPTPSAVSSLGQLVFSERTGRLVAIYAFGGVKTPQGIGLDHTYAELHAAYPGWAAIGPDSTSGRGGVAVPGNPDAHYRIVTNGLVVKELSLDADTQDCYE